MIKHPYQPFSSITPTKHSDLITSIVRSVSREVIVKMLLGILLFSAAIYVDARLATYQRSEPSVCLSEDCMEFARKIKWHMRPSANPCVDFYEYACGNWWMYYSASMEEHPSIMRLMSDRENKRKVEEILAQPLLRDEIPPVKIAKQWYQTCMDTGDMNKRGMQPLMSILSEIGGWPITMARNKWNGSEQKWQNVDDYYAHLTGSNLLHDVRVTAYGGKSKVLNPVLDVPNMPQYSWLLMESSNSDNETNLDKKEFKSSDKYWKFVRKIVLSVAEAQGYDIPTDQLEEDIKNMFTFTWKLSKITSLVDDYVNMTARDFQKWYNDLGPRTEKSMVNWIDKIIGTFKESGIDLSNDTIIKVSSPGYFKRLILVLDETSSRTIVNYLHWNFVSNAIKMTTDEMRKLFEKIVGDDWKKQTRSDWCIEEAQMNDVIAYKYKEDYFMNFNRMLAFDALDDIVKEMEIEIGKSNWASKEIKDLASKRIRSIKKNIAYPDWYNNRTIMENYFDNLTLGPTFFENALRLQRYYKQKELWLLQHKNDVKPWLVDPLTINAFYLSESNSITVPMANLQVPFFSITQTNTINYALTGYLMAHELYHSFDELRRLYNEHGVEINWPEIMTAEYYRSAQCFVEQFNNYTLDGTPYGPKVENYGNQTFNENMADTMGLKTAFRAYKLREKIVGVPEMILPGIWFNTDQQFFLSFANLWCDTRTPETLAVEAKLDIHSIPRIRTIGSLSNNEDFAKAFSCPLGSPMNPKKKCNIWQT